MAGPWSVAVRSADPAEAHFVGARVYHDHRLDVLGDRDRFAMSLHAVRLGAVTVGWLSYGTEVRISSAEFGDSYQVNMLGGGSMQARSGDAEIVGTPELAMVYRADLPSSFRGWQSPYPLLGLRIERDALERELERLLARPVEGAIDFEPGLDVSAGHGADWRALALTLAAAAGNEQSLLRKPLVAQPLISGVLAGLLSCARHRFRTWLDAPAPLAGPAAVRRACAYIDEHAAQPLTVPEIAAHAGVSVRSLQAAFGRALGLSPSAFLRQVRLTRAHDALRATDPASATVADVAASWGFVHAGRFAAHYRRRFGVAPSATLRRGA